ncbi:uncharacterized protein A4U43_C10F18040 [Asparagus officinalis]|uniref:WAT1-related protein n=1 Tax=Asparagus officinalis TaxID=4686 RepID=A0A5P1E3V9_ASPOF|nr:uncharacterized protein A4U43_C10F18040 [Asparagus officinalis]
MSQAYPCHYSTTALMCLMAAVQANVYALCMDRHWDHWRLGFDVRLLTVVYVGVVASALILTVLSWCIKQKGPLYASVFNPLMLVIVAFLGSLLLDEKLHVGRYHNWSSVDCDWTLHGSCMGGSKEELFKVAEIPTTDETIDVVIEPDKASLQEEDEADKSKDNDPSLNKKDEEFARE